MSNTKEKPRGNDVRELLSELLNFGPTNETIDNDFTDKIRQIIKKLQEISRRIDHLSSRY